MNFFVSQTTTVLPLTTVPDHLFKIICNVFPSLCRNHTSNNNATRPTASNTPALIYVAVDRYGNAPTDVTVT